MFGRSKISNGLKVKKIYTKGPKSKATKLGGSRWRLTHADRTQLKLAKLNKSATKSAISEFGKTARSIAAQVSANKAVENINTAQTNRIMANQTNSSDSMNRAIDIYNRIIEGNAEKQGNNQDESTTNVGGGGSYLGG